MSGLCFPVFYCWRLSISRICEPLEIGSHHWFSASDADSQLWPSIPNEAALSNVTAFSDGLFFIYSLFFIYETLMVTNFLMCRLVKGVSVYFLCNRPIKRK